LVTVALFDDQGRARVSAAVAELERESAGEIVVVSAPRADSYHDVRAFGAFAFALAFAGCLHVLVTAFAFSWVLALQLPAFLAAFALLRWPPLLRAALPHARVRAAVERRARDELLAQGVLETRERTGVLILLCELERRVVILGDKGVHARVQDAGWERHVAHIVAAIRAGRAADGVSEVIAELAKVLARDLPRSPDDVNELPDAPREPER
jgi:putative membrane protein